MISRKALERIIQFGKSFRIHGNQSVLPVTHTYSYQQYQIKKWRDLKMFHSYNTPQMYYNWVRWSGRSISKRHLRYSAIISWCSECQKTLSWSIIMLPFPNIFCPGAPDLSDRFRYGPSQYFYKCGINHMWEGTHRLADTRLLSVNEWRYQIVMEQLFPFTQNGNTNTCVVRQ